MSGCGSSVIVACFASFTAVGTSATNRCAKKLNSKPSSEMKGRFVGFDLARYNSFSATCAPYMQIGQVFPSFFVASRCPKPTP
jgi:hypothetical protein